MVSPQLLLEGHLIIEFKKTQSVENALEAISKKGYAELVEKESDLLLQIFEEVFNF